MPPNIHLQLIVNNNQLITCVIVSGLRMISPFIPTCTAAWCLLRTYVRDGGSSPTSTTVRFGGRYPTEPLSSIIDFISLCIYKKNKLAVLTNNRDRWLQTIRHS